MADWISNPRFAELAEDLERARDVAQALGVPTPRLMTWTRRIAEQRLRRLHGRAVRPASAADWAFHARGERGWT